MDQRPSPPPRPTSEPEARQLVFEVCPIIMEYLPGSKVGSNCTKPGIRKPHCPFEMTDFPLPLPDNGRGKKEIGERKTGKEGRESVSVLVRMRIKD